MPPFEPYGTAVLMPFENSRGELYRERADEVRALAADCRDATIKEQFLRIADEYEALAHQVEAGILPT